MDLRNRLWIEWVDLISFYSKEWTGCQCPHSEMDLVQQLWKTAYTKEHYVLLFSKNEWLWSRASWYIERHLLRDPNVLCDLCHKIPEGRWHLKVDYSFMSIL
jgi:hypothetical protein